MNFKSATHILLAFFLGYSTCVFSQGEKPQEDRSKFGMLGGWNYTKVKVNEPFPTDSPEAVELEGEGNIYLGAYFRSPGFVGNDRLSLLGEFGVGSNNAYTNYTYVVDQDNYQENSVTVITPFLRLTVMGRFDLLSGNIKPYVSAGGSISKILGDGVIVSQQTYSNGLPSGGTQVWLESNQSELEGILGTGVLLKFFFLETRFGYGFANRPLAGSYNIYVVGGFEF